MNQLTIIGNGISGVTLARHVRKRSNCKIKIISEETDYFFSRTALMYIYMGHMKLEHTQPYEKHFWKRNKIELVKARVESVNTQNQTLALNNGSTINYETLVIATGSKPNKFGWPGQDLEGVTGLYHLQDLERLERWSTNTKHAAIVGGGLIGIELAEMFHTRNIHTSFLVREKSFWGKVLPAGESAMINQEILEHRIDLQLNTNLTEILDNGEGKVAKVKTDKNQTIDCQIVGLTPGVSPNIDFLEASGIETQKGVMVNRKLETNVPNVYAIGDCAQQHKAIGLRRPIEAVWYTGRIMGETLAMTLTGSPKEYEPGHWFNSAKFFTIEYQTYGWVFAQPQENEKHLHWMHDSNKKCITISYDSSTGKFQGINTFGIRMRHEYFNEMLNKKADVQEVIKKLKQANFDPEFYTQHETEIHSSFNLSN